MNRKKQDERETEPISIDGVKPSEATPAQLHDAANIDLDDPEGKPKDAQAQPAPAAAKAGLELGGKTPICPHCKAAATLGMSIAVFPAGMTAMVFFCNECRNILPAVPIGAAQQQGAFNPSRRFA